MTSKSSLTSKFLSILFSFSLVFSTAGQSFASVEAGNVLKIARVQGDVQVCKGDSCAAGGIGQVLQVGETVKVGPASRAVLVLGKKDTFEIRERSRILVDQISPKESKLEVFVGSLKATIHAAFFQTKRVSIVTPTGVMAVRGTQVMCRVSEKGDTDFAVHYGHADFRDTKGQVKEFIQGERYTATAVRLGAEEALHGTETEAGSKQEGGVVKDEKAKGQEKLDEAKNEEAGQPEYATGETQKGELDSQDFVEALGGKEAYQNRMEIENNMEQGSQEFANDQEVVSEQVRTALDNDISAGRTLRDIHGNLVRVEQRLIRPSADQVQFVNLVKRDSYVYKGFFEYNGGGGARKDSMDASITFNKTLPENINEWPSFFSSEGDDMHVNRAVMKASNGSDSLENTVLYNSARKETGGVACDGTKVMGTSCFQEMLVKVGSGQALIYDKPNGGGKEIDGSANGDLKNYLEQPLLVANSTIGGVSAGDTLWLLFENYAIDNGGSVLNINKILSENIIDPFSYLRTVAGEAIVTVKKGNYNTSTNAGGTILFANGNIDLVIIPDLAVDLAQKFASHIQGSFGD